MLAIQIRQGEAGTIELYRTTHALDTAAARDHLLHIGPVTLHEVSAPILTSAGKTQRLL